MIWSQLIVFMFTFFGVLAIPGLWIAISLGTAGIVTMYTNSASLLQVIGNIVWKLCTDFTITAIPLFLFMGEIIIHCGVSRNFYKGIAKYLKKIPGGMLHSNIVACAIFSAISGSSPATAAAIGSVAIPEMEMVGYKKKYTFGSIAAGGTLGILIPPSINLIIYCSLTAQSVTTMFTAALVPGLVLSLIYLIYLLITALIKRKDFADVDFSVYEDLNHKQALLGVLPMVIMIGAVLGTIYGGVATATEAAGLGAAMAIVVSIIAGDFNLRKLWTSLTAAIKTTAMILFIMLGAQIFTYVMSSTHATSALVEWLIAMNVSRGLFLFIICTMYVFLGCFMDGNSMLYLTLPVLYPILLAYEINIIWFGVVLVVLVEMGMITPPMGLNLFVVKGLDKNVTLAEILSGTWQYLFLMVLMVLILMAFPTLATFMVT